MASAEFEELKLTIALWGFIMASFLFDIMALLHFEIALVGSFVCITLAILTHFSILRLGK